MKFIFGVLVLAVAVQALSLSDVLSRRLSQTAEKAMARGKEKQEARGFRMFVGGRERKAVESPVQAAPKRDPFDLFPLAEEPGQANRAPNVPLSDLGNAKAYPNYVPYLPRNTGNRRRRRALADDTTTAAPQMDVMPNLPPINLQVKQQVIENCGCGCQSSNCNCTGH